MAWMGNLVGTSGKLVCPGKNGACGAKLGSWDWAGERCATGKWVAPAFRVVASKVDARKRSKRPDEGPLVSEKLGVSLQWLRAAPPAAAVRGGAGSFGARRGRGPSIEMPMAFEPRPSDDAHGLRAAAERRCSSLPQVILVAHGAAADAKDDLERLWGGRFRAGGEVAAARNRTRVEE